MAECIKTVFLVQGVSWQGMPYLIVDKISSRSDYQRQKHYDHNTITIIDQLLRYYHDSSFEGNLKKQALIPLSTGTNNFLIHYA